MKYWITYEADEQNDVIIGPDATSVCPQPFTHHHHMHPRVLVEQLWSWGAKGQSTEGSESGAMMVDVHSLITQSIFQKFEANVENIDTYSVI